MEFVPLHTKGIFIVSERNAVLHLEFPYVAYLTKEIYQTETDNQRGLRNADNRGGYMSIKAG